MTGTSTNFQHCFPPVADNLGAGRRALSGWLAERAVGTEVIDDLSVVFSELAANAISASTSGGDICTRAWIDDPHVVLEVANDLDRAAAGSVRRWDLDDPLRPGGRGLLIVRAYTDDVEVVSSDDGGRIVVRCRCLLA